MSRVLRSHKENEFTASSIPTRRNTRSQSMLPTKVTLSAAPHRHSIVPKKLTKSKQVVDVKHNDPVQVKDIVNGSCALSECEIIGRISEMSQLSQLLESHLHEKRSGSVYVSGAPGTGKTAVVMHVTKSLLNSTRVTALVNCMNLGSSSEVFSRILHCLKTDCSSSANAAYVESVINKMFVNRSIILVLDEIDQLSCRGQDILYRIFDWPIKLSCHIIIIGIANALDLPERLLPRIKANEHKPIHIVFPPYSQNELADILSAHLSKVTGSLSIMQPLAIQLCARKIAASTGDVRKALDVCRRAIDLATLEARSNNNENFDESQCEKIPQVIPTIQHISLALKESQNNVVHVFSKSTANGTNSTNTEMPLHHKLLLASCMLLRRQKNLRELPFSHLFDTYRLICERKKLTGLDESELASVCELLDSHGLVQFINATPSSSIDQKLGTPARLRRVKLRLDDHGVELALRDDLLLSSVMSLKLN